MKTRLFFPILLVVLMGCKDDDPKPTAAEQQGNLLAGKKGESKTWILTSFVIDGTDVFDGLCEYDNEYTFFNTAAQSFEGTEGEEECTFWDDINEDGIVDAGEVFSFGEDIETGVWAFTLDGKTLIISSSDTQSEFAIFSLFTEIGSPLPASIIKLTDTELSLEMNTSVGSQNFEVTVEFEAVQPAS